MSDERKVAGERRVWNRQMRVHDVGHDGTSLTKRVFVPSLSHASSPGGFRDVPDKSNLTQGHK